MILRASKNRSPSANLRQNKCFQDRVFSMIQLHGVPWRRGRFKTVRVAQLGFPSWKCGVPVMLTWAGQGWAVEGALQSPHRAGIAWEVRASRAETWALIETWKCLLSFKSYWPQWWRIEVLAKNQMIMKNKLLKKVLLSAYRLLWNYWAFSSVSNLEQMVEILLKNQYSQWYSRSRF